MSRESRRLKYEKNRADIDRRHEQTEARIAFQRWRNERFPINGKFWDMWDEEGIDSYWEKFLAGWRSCQQRLDSK